MFSSVETIVKQTELLTLAEQWELLSQLVQRLRPQVLPPATAATSSFSEQLRPRSGPELTKAETQKGTILAVHNPFPPTRVEDVAGCLKYSGPPKTLADMEDAIQVGVLESWHEGY